MNRFIKHFYINYFLFSLLSAQLNINEYIEWNNLQKKDITIEYSWGKNFPLCKADIELNYSIDEILSIIENVNNYYLIFDSVVSSKQYHNNNVHIVLDMPFPFQDRDYIVKFIKYLKDNDVVYSFSATNDHNIENIDNTIRLINAMGEWRLKAINEHFTKVTYIWNGELRGNFPSWSLSTAWTRQGNEVLNNLKEQLDDKEQLNEIK